MLISYFTEDAYFKLLGAISANSSKYRDGFDDIETLGISKSDCPTSSIDLPLFALVPLEPGASNEEKNRNDLVNIQSVYDHWKSLTPWQAHNKFMWTYYCHLPRYQEYIRSRWMQEGFSDSQIKDRFFVTETKRNLVRENALSSLWWKGYLTYDESREDHYWQTKALNTTTNLADFLDTFNSFNPTRAKGVIGAMSEVQEELRIDKLPSKVFRQLNRYLNHYAAVSILDYLTVEEIRELSKAKLYEIIDTSGLS